MFQPKSPLLGLLFAPALVLLAPACAVVDDDVLPNRLNAVEAQAGWELLFDGTSTKGWRGFRKEGMPAGWEVRDGTLALTGSGGDIVTQKVYADFILTLEWKISPAGNSGIFFRVAEDGQDAVWRTGPEMQVLDNTGHPDGQDARTSAGANYALHAPPADFTRPVGEWNEVRIEVRDGRVRHWLNGYLCVDYKLGSEDWKELVAASKFGAMPDYGRAPVGHIALQDHGDPVWYRNIKILPLE